jgi:translation initiation factor 5A
MADTKSEPVHDVRVGKYIVIDNVPCKVVDVNRSAPGKHGHAKFRITAISLFDDKKKVLVMSGGGKMEVPHVDKRTAQILSISDSTANAMDMESYETFDIEVPEELKESLKEGDQFMYWIVMGKKLLQQKK